LKNTQTRMLETHNENRKKKDYHVGQVDYEKKHGERNKLKSRYILCGLLRDVHRCLLVHFET